MDKILDEKIIIMIPYCLAINVASASTLSFLSECKSNGGTVSLQEAVVHISTLNGISHIGRNYQGAVETKSEEKDISTEESYHLAGEGAS